MGRILFVENYLGIRKVYSFILGSAGYYLKFVNTGYEALQIIERDNFDIIICDYLLPDTNGIHLIKKIKQKHESIYSILFTSFPLDDFGKTEFDEYVLKACPKDSLLKTIEKGLEIRKERLSKLFPDKELLLCN